MRCREGLKRLQTLQSLHADFTNIIIALGTDFGLDEIELSDVQESTEKKKDDYSNEELMEVAAEQERSLKTAGNEDLKHHKLMAVICISRDFAEG
jgi:hypothetical protein